MDDIEVGVPLTGADFNATNEVAIFLGRIAEEFEAIDAGGLGSLLGHGSVILIDARRPDEYMAGHIGGALNIPAGKIEFSAEDLDRNAPTIVYGNDGWSMEAFVAADKLRTLFFKDIRVLSGGFAAWKKTGHIVEPNTRTACVA